MRKKGLPAIGTEPMVNLLHQLFNGRIVGYRRTFACYTHIVAMHAFARQLILNKPIIVIIWAYNHFIPLTNTSSICSIPCDLTDIHNRNVAGIFGDCGSCVVCQFPWKRYTDFAITCAEWKRWKIYTNNKTTQTLLVYGLRSLSRWQPLPNPNVLSTNKHTKLISFHKCKVGMLLLVLSTAKLFNSMKAINGRFERLFSFDLTFNEINQGCRCRFLVFSSWWEIIFRTLVI